MDHLLEYSIVGIYLLVLIGLGIAFRSQTKGSDDYFRGGGKGTWWLVGMSLFMAGLSAHTFVGGAGVAFEAGWSVMVIYAAGALGAFIQMLFLAHRFRQTRATTMPDLIRQRFGPVTEQVYTVWGMFFFLLTAGIWLWGLSIFVSTAFDMDVRTVIIGAGIVVLIYSTAGGVWAVMATDMVQSLLMFAMASLLTILCFVQLGGIGPLFTGIEAAGLADDYTIIKSDGEKFGGHYTLGWALAIMAYTVIMLCSLAGPIRFFVAKDGREARKAAGVGGLLMLVAMVVFFIPPITARLLFEDAVMNPVDGGVSKPAETSYAVASRMLLPQGLMGLMAVAMFSATMSSMDTGLNQNAAMVCRNLLPAIFRVLRKPMPGDKALLLIGQIMTVCFGLIIIGVALSYTLLQELGMFELRLKIDALLALPLAVALMMGLLFRRTPGWSGMFVIIIGLAGSAVGMISEINGAPWNFAEMVLVVSVVCVAAFFFTMLFWKRAPAEDQARINAFFDKMLTPVDFEAEIGEANDDTQLRKIGFFAVAIGLLIPLLMLIPGSLRDRLSILYVAAFLALIGGFMVWRGRKQKAAKEAASDDAVAVGPATEPLEEALLTARR